MLRSKQISFIAVLTLYSLSLSAQKTPEYYINIIETTSDNQEKFRALDSLLFPLKWGPHTEQFVNYSETYVDLAIEREQYEDAIEAVIRCVYTINTALGQPERSLQLLEKVEQYKSKTNDTYLLGGIHLKKGGNYFNGKSFDKAIDNYSIAINTYSENDSIYKADAIFFRAQAHFSKGDFLNAINDYNLAVKYYESLDDIDYTLFARSELINCYGANGFNEKSIEERSKIIDLRLKTNRLDGIVSDYFNQSHNYGKLGFTEKQEAYLKKALNYLDKDKADPHLKQITLNAGIANFYLDQSHLKKAKRHLDIAQEKVKTFDKTSYANFYVSVVQCKYLFFNGEYKNAEKLATNTLGQAKKWGEVNLVIDLNDLLYKLYSKTGEYEIALNYLEQKKSLEDSIFSIEKANAFSYYQTLHETEVKEKEILEQNVAIELLQKDKTIEQSKKRLWVFVLSVIILIALTIIYLIRQRAERLKLKIENHKKELEIFTSELLDKSREYELLSSELEVLKEDKKTENKLDKLQDLTSSKILTVEDWETFKIKFENVYPKFFVKVRIANSDITNAEERLLALEKLNLKTPEIANILGVSTDSVVKNRYRLRKKLGISRSTSITEFVEA